MRHVFSSLSLIMRADGEQISSAQLQTLVESDIFPQIQHSIKSLKLRWGIFGGGSVGPDFAPFLPLFPALHTLELIGWFGGGLYFPSANIGPSIPFLPKLRIVGHAPHPRQHDPRALCSVLSVFDAVGRIELASVRLRKWIHVDEEQLGIWKIPHVTSLDLNGFIPAPCLYSIFKSLIRTTSLQSFAFRTITADGELPVALNISNGFPPTPRNTLHTVICLDNLRLRTFLFVQPSHHSLYRHAQRYTPSRSIKKSASTPQAPWSLGSVWRFLGISPPCGAFWLPSLSMRWDGGN